MPLPPSVTKTTKEGVQIISNVDRCSYTIKELTRAALRDVGKYVVLTANRGAQKLYHNSLSKAKKRVKGLKGAFQYWARKREGDLIVGITHNTWYGTEQEIGSSKMPKKGILTNTVQDNMPTIVKIESQYLSALEDEATALNLISDEEYRGDEDDT